MAHLTGKVVADGLNLHVSPPNGEIIDKLAKGDTFDVLEHVHTKTVDWLRVQVHHTGRFGYVAEFNHVTKKKFVQTYYRPAPVNDIPAPAFPMPEGFGHWPFVWAGVAFAIIVALVLMLR